MDYLNLTLISKAADRLQLLETSVGNVIRFRKRRILTKWQSLHFCLLDPPVFQCHVFRLPRLTGKLYRVNDLIISL